MEELTKTVQDLTLRFTDVNDKISDLSVIAKEVRSVNDNLRNLSERITIIERGEQSQQNRDQSVPNQGIDPQPVQNTYQEIGTDPNQEPVEAQQSSRNSSGSDLSKVLSGDVQGEFRHIKNIYQNKDLPPEIRLNVDRTGIKREDQPRFNLIASVSKYPETILKILASDVDKDTQLEQIFTIAIAQQRYLQDEYSSVLVNSSFNSQTARFFRTLQKNTSSFPAQALANLQAAATISAAASPSQPNYNPPRRGFNPRGRGYRGRGNYRNDNRDVYQSMVNANVPSSRPNDPHDD